MSEHSHLNNNQLNNLIKSRLSQGKLVGRLLQTARNRGQSTKKYQSQRTRKDIEKDVRWKSYHGKAALEESAELARREISGSKSRKVSVEEHKHLTTQEVHTKVQRRLEEGLPVGRLLNTLQEREEDTRQYQAKRTKTDIEAHIRWMNSQGIEPLEEKQELVRRVNQEFSQRFKPSQPAPLSSVPSLLRKEKIDPIQNATTEFFDVFISHASDDKDTIVRQLASALRAAGLRVWYDEFELEIGASLRRKIDHGIAKSRFGIVVLSQAFFKKDWTNYELDGIVTRSVTGEQVLLPIWHNVSKDEVMDYSPSLVDKLARSTATHTIQEIALEIADLIKGGNKVTFKGAQKASNNKDIREIKNQGVNRPWWRFW